jgi:IS5 family transposase
MSRLPDRANIPRFRRLLEQHQFAEQFLKTVNAQLTAKGYLLKERTAVDATLIAAPSSAKNKSGERDPAMHQTKKGNMWHFGMKCHICVDADSGRVLTVVGTAANVYDVTQAPGVFERHIDVAEAFCEVHFRLHAAPWAWSANNRRLAMTRSAKPIRLNNCASFLGGPL